jgi:hypothetical protein
MIEHYYQNIGENFFTYPGLYSSMVKKFDSGSKFVEVGTWRGRSACFLGVEILNSGKDITLDCVDTWDGINCANYVPGHNINFLSDDLYNQFLMNIEPIKSVIKPVRQFSNKASEYYEDNSLEFVFIDASHEYDGVKEDLALWYPKVKKGGVFAGHDYTQSWPGVVKAVNEFFKSIGKPFETSECCWIHYK